MWTVTVLERNTKMTEIQKFKSCELQLNKSFYFISGGTREAYETLTEEEK